MILRYTRHAVFFAAIGIAGTAGAQTPPEAPPAAGPAGATTGTAETPPPAPPPTAPPALTPADAARLDDIEQSARISLRKHELLEEEAAKRAKEAPKLSVDDKGFSMALPDKFLRAEDSRR